MSKLIPITLFSLIFALLSHNYSDYDPIKGVYLRKERLCYAMMSIGLILFAGLRTGYNDTGTYREAYNILVSPDLEKIRDINWLKIGDNPGFETIQIIMKHWGVSTQSFIMLFSIFTVGVHLWFFRKYSCNLFMTILLFITFDAYLFNLAAIKQCTAMSLCLIATDRAIQKKYLSFVIYVLFASLFHAYALMYLAVPFLFFRPWSKYTFIMMAFFATVGISLEYMLGSLLDVTDMLGENYTAASFSGEGVNIIRLLVTAAPVFLSFMIMPQIADVEERDQYVIMNLCMLNAEIMFVALFGTANYFGRLANYFIPFQSLALPWLVKHFDYKGRAILTMTIAGCYLMYFVYAQSIHTRFDNVYWSVPLWQYLKTLFQGVI